MSEAGRISAEGDRSASIGGDVINSILITGDPNIIFIGDYECLRDAYIPPWSVFEWVNLERFIGRDWLTAEIDAFLADNDRGYFILEAKAGLGKTAFLAHLVEERGYIHHFVGLAPGQDGVARGLKNLAAQLVRAWELDRYSVDEVLPGAAARPDFLQNLLFEAARRRDEFSPEEKIVLVVDALDEAYTPAGQNALGLPKVLPEGVYFIVSQRPAQVLLTVEGPRRVFPLEAADEHNLTDMRVYLEQATTREEMARALDESQVSSEDLVETLLAKCQGVWIYLQYVVDEIERGKRFPLNLETLPRGVWGYYAQYWRRWRGEHLDDWDAAHLPLLSTLAAVQQEDVTIDFLCELLGVTQSQALHRTLEEEWQPFLIVSKGERNRYRLYHASLREFLDGRAEVADLTNQERVLTRELADATRRTHSRIADRYLAAWGGLEDGLPGLQDPAIRDKDDRYGLRYVVAHLYKAGRNDDLHRLLTLEWSDTKEVVYPDRRRELKGWLDQMPKRSQHSVETRYHNTWYTAKEQSGDVAGYRSDVEQAWRLVADIGLQSPAAIGYQCRYGLIMASLNSMAANIPPELLAALVKRNKWTVDRARSYALSVPDVLQRIETLIALVPHLSEPEKGDTLQEAVAIARTIIDQKTQEKVLIDLVFQLTESGYLKEALTVLLDLPADDSQNERDSPRFKVLADLAPRLAEQNRFEESLAAIQAIRSNKLQTEVLAAVASHLPEDFVRKALVDWKVDEARQAVLIPRLAELGYPEEALARVRQVYRFHYAEKSETLIKLAPHLPEALLWEVLTEAWTLDTDNLVKTLVELAPHLTESQLQEAMGAFLELSEREPSWSYHKKTQTQALSALIPQLAELGYVKATFAAAKNIKNRRQRATLLVKPISQLAKSGDPKRVLAIARTLPEVALGYDSPQAAALVALAPYLRGPLIHEALEVVRRMNLARPQADALVALIPCLPEPLLAEALPMALAIEWEEPRAKALTSLIPHLPECLLDDVLEAARKIQDRDHQATVMSVLIPQLADSGHLEEALSATRLIRPSHYLPDVQTTLLYYYPNKVLATVLVDLAPRLTEPMLQEALLAAREIEWAEARIEALIGLIPYLPGDERIEVIQGIFATAIDESAEVRIKALVALAPYLPDDERVEVLRLALKEMLVVQNVEDSGEELANLVNQLPEAQRTSVLNEALTFAAELRPHTYFSRSQPEALIELAPHLPVQLLHKALEMARALPGEVDTVNVSPKVESLVVLALQLSEPQRTQVIREALAIVPTFDEVRQAGVVVRIAAHLPESLLSEVLALMQGIHQSDRRMVALVSLAPHLPEPLLNKALAMVREIDRAEQEEWKQRSWRTTRRDRSSFAQALASMAPFLSEPGRTEALNEALQAVRDIRPREIWHECDRSQMFMRLVPHLSEPERAQALREAIASVQELPEESLIGGSLKVIALAGLIPHLPKLERDQAVKEALAAVSKISGREGRAKLLIVLVPRLCGPELTQALELVQEAPQDFDYNGYGYLTKENKVRIEAQVKLLSKLVELGHIEEAFDMARKLPEARSCSSDIGSLWAKALVDLTPQLSRRLQLEALTIIQNLPSGEARVTALAELASYLPEPLLHIALSEIQEMWSDEAQAAALVKLAPHLPKPLLPEALTCAQKLGVWAGEARVAALVELARYLPQPLLWKALTDIIEETWTTNEAQVRMFVGLARHLTEPLLMEALKHVQRTQPEEAQAAVLSGLASFMPERLFWEAVQWVQEMQLQEARVTALIGLAPHLTGPLLTYWATSEATIMSFQGRKSSTLVTLVQLLAELGYPEEALAIVPIIYHSDDRTEALVKLIPHLPEDLLEEAASVTQSIRDEYSREEVLVDLMVDLARCIYSRSAPGTTQLNQYVDYWVKAWIEQSYKLPEQLLAKALAGLAPYLSEPLLEEALKTVSAIRWDKRQVEAFLGLVPYLSSEPLLQEALKTVHTISWAESQVEALLGLTPRLPEHLLPEALAIARAIEWNEERMKALAGIAQYLPTSEQRRVLEEAVQAGIKIQREYGEPEAITALVLQIAQSDYPNVALETAQKIEYGPHQAKVLAQLARYLPEPLLRETLDAVQRNHGERERLEALIGLIPRLAEIGYSDDALTLIEALPTYVFEYTARSMGIDQNPVVVMLTRIAPHLTEVQQLEGAMALAQRVTIEKLRAEAMVAIVPKLAELGQCDEALATARKLPETTLGQYACPQIQAMAALIPYLPKEAHDYVLEEALAAGRAIEWDKSRVVALVTLAPHLPEAKQAEVWKEALAVARIMAREAEWVIEAKPGPPVNLFSYIAEFVDVEEAWAAIFEITGEWQQAKVLEDIVPRLPVILYSEAVALVRQMESDEARFKALRALALQLSQLPPEELYPLWLETSYGLATRTRKDLLSDLGALASVIVNLGKTEAVEETVHAIQDVGRWWA